MTDDGPPTPLHTPPMVITTTAAAPAISACRRFRTLRRASPANQSPRAGRAMPAFVRSASVIVGPSSRSGPFSGSGILGSFLAQPDLERCQGSVDVRPCRRLRAMQQNADLGVRE